MTLTLRYMDYHDISQVVAIDRQAFDTPWTSRSYAYEIGESTYSHMAVLEHAYQQPVQGVRSLVRRLSGSRPGFEMRRDVVAYGGLWCIQDEGHISTIATDPERRGQGFGEILLAAMVRRAITLSASYIVLEVRVSNVVAQRLYEKYDFEMVDVKNQYYRDNGEDAYDMRLDLLSPDVRGRFQSRYESLVARYHISDLYTDAVLTRR